MRKWRARSLLAIAALFGAAPPPTDVIVAGIGRAADGAEVHRFTFANRHGLTVSVIDLGAAVTSVRMPVSRGAAAEMVLAPGGLAGVLASGRRYGAVVGRYAGRFRGHVSIDGRVYPLAVNASGVTLHGGDPGLDRALWSGHPFEDADTVGVTFSLVSPAGSQGFPGALSISVRYALARRRDELRLTTQVESDRPTVVNLTNHSYFNLAGGGSVACHRLRVDAPRMVETDARRLPTGRLVAVAGTPLDFTSERPLGPVLNSRAPVLATAGGLDHFLVLRRGGKAVLSDPASGRRLTVTTTEPGFQVYAVNAFDGSDRDALGRPIERHGGLAIEAQHLPDSPSIPTFPSTRVGPGQPVHSVTRWLFEAGRPAEGGTSCRA